MRGTPDDPPGEATASSGGSPPRVAFFSSYWTKGDEIDLGGSDYWRLAVPAGALYENGWDVIFGRCVAQAKDGTLQIQDPVGNWYDDREIIVWQRWMGKDTAEALLRARAVGQVVINDVDDHYWGLPREHVARDGTDPLLHPLYNREHYRETLKASSLLTVSTPFLARELERWGTTRVVRNRIDLDAWPTSPPGDHVGWVGATPWRGADVEILRDTVVPWLRDRGLFFYHGGHMADGKPVAELLGYDRVTTRPMVPLSSYRHLWDPLRVALIPIEDSPFGRAKSAVKGLEAAARGVPFIVSDHEEYRALGAGLIAERPEDWVRHLEALEDPGFYAAEVRRNRERVEELSIERNWREWDVLLREARMLASPGTRRPAATADGPDFRTLSRRLPRDVEESLAEIPSATTASERGLAYRYAASIWDGKSDVFENGPLLGGVTRALAMGMLANPRRSTDALLHTFDWFSLRDENPLDLAPGTLEALVAARHVPADRLAAAARDGSFLPVFRALHGGRDYWQIVRPHVGYLPGHRDDVPDGGEAIFELPFETPFGLLFVDGCKSWYGTKHWLIEVCDRVLPGAHFLFQDFGQYTCFWLPMLVGLLSDHFVPVACVDHTYTFQLARTLSPDVVADRFPDEPTDVDPDVYDRVFSAAIDAAAARGDLFAEGALGAQHAAAYAYLGESEEARGMLDALLARTELVFMRDYLLRARRSPTYTPEGAIAL